MDPERKRAHVRDARQDGASRRSRSGFPSASQPDFDFVRLLIEEDLVPDDVDDPGADQCRPELIQRTYECLRGRAPGHRALLQLRPRSCSGAWCSASTSRASSTSPSTRPSSAGSSRRHWSAREIFYEYSPESYTGTEVEFAVEICEAVMDVIEPTPRQEARPEPAGDGRDVQPEPLRRHHRVVPAARSRRRDRVVLSLHPHNDRGCAVAAAELGVLAGADRVEGTLFGNGERTGNVDVDHARHEPLRAGRRPRARHHRHRRPAPGGRVL